MSNTQLNILRARRQMGSDIDSIKAAHKQIIEHELISMCLAAELVEHNDINKQYTSNSSVSSIILGKISDVPNYTIKLSTGVCYRAVYDPFVTNEELELLEKGGRKLHDTEAGREMLQKVNNQVNLMMMPVAMAFEFSKVDFDFAADDTHRRLMDERRLFGIIQLLGEDGYNQLIRYLDVLYYKRFNDFEMNLDYSQRSNYQMEKLWDQLVDPIESVTVNWELINRLASDLRKLRKLKGHEIEKLMNSYV